MLKGKKIVCARIVYSIYSQKSETCYTRIIIGENILDYNSNTKVPMADLVTIKLLLNSALSTLRAKIMTINIKNFYLEIELIDKQYIFLIVELVLEEIITEYNL